MDVESGVPYVSSPHLGPDRNIWAVGGSGDSGVTDSEKRALFRGAKAALDDGDLHETLACILELLNPESSPKPLDFSDAGK